ncbi:hypothetical protein Pst134EB_010523 [Puccinia striiformis f. sp. tritici]|nr:hypothetical protein Pst134EB_010523 [Puccinia striiformis f. sp. tritici]
MVASKPFDPWNKKSTDGMLKKFILSHQPDTKFEAYVAREKLQEMAFELQLQLAETKEVTTSTSGSRSQREKRSFPAANTESHPTNITKQAQSCSTASSQVDKHTKQTNSAKGTATKSNLGPTFESNQPVPTSRAPAPTHLTAPSSSKITSAKRSLTPNPNVAPHKRVRQVSSAQPNTKKPPTAENSQPINHNARKRAASVHFSNPVDDKGTERPSLSGAKKSRPSTSSVAPEASPHSISNSSKTPITGINSGKRKTAQNPDSSDSSSTTSSGSEEEDDLEEEDTDNQYDSEIERVSRSHYEESGTGSTSLSELSEENDQLEISSESLQSSDDPVISTSQKPSLTSKLSTGFKVKSTQSGYQSSSGSKHTVPPHAQNSNKAAPQKIVLVHQKTSATKQTSVPTPSMTTSRPNSSRDSAATKEPFIDRSQCYVPGMPLIFNDNLHEQQNNHKQPITSQVVQPLAPKGTSSQIPTPPNPLSIKHVPLSAYPLPSPSVNEAHLSNNSAKKYTSGFPPTPVIGQQGAVTHSIPPKQPVVPKQPASVSAGKPASEQTVRPAEQPKSVHGEPAGTKVNSQFTFNPILSNQTTSHHQVDPAAQVQITIPGMGTFVGSFLNPSNCFVQPSTSGSFNSLTSNDNRTTGNLAELTSPTPQNLTALNNIPTSEIPQPFLRMANTEPPPPCPEIKSGPENTNLPVHCASFNPQHPTTNPTYKVKELKPWIPLMLNENAGSHKRRNAKPWVPIALTDTETAVQPTKILPASEKALPYLPLTDGSSTATLCQKLSHFQSPPVPQMEVPVALDPPALQHGPSDALLLRLSNLESLMTKFFASHLPSSTLSQTHEGLQSTAPFQPPPGSAETLPQTLEPLEQSIHSMATAILGPKLSPFPIAAPGIVAARTIQPHRFNFDSPGHTSTAATGPLTASTSEISDGRPLGPMSHGNLKPSTIPPLQSTTPLGTNHFSLPKSQTSGTVTASNNQSDIFKFESPELHRPLRSLKRSSLQSSAPARSICEFQFECNTTQEHILKSIKLDSNTANVIGGHENTVTKGKFLSLNTVSDAPQQSDTVIGSHTKPISTKVNFTSLKTMTAAPQQTGKEINTSSIPDKNDKRTSPVLILPTSPKPVKINSNQTQEETITMTNKPTIESLSSNDVSHKSASPASPTIPESSLLTSCLQRGFTAFVNPINQPQLPPTKFNNISNPLSVEPKIIKSKVHSLAEIVNPSTRSYDTSDEQVKLLPTTAHEQPTKTMLQPSELKHNAIQDYEGTVILPPTEITDHPLESRGFSADVDSKTLPGLSSTTASDISAEKASDLLGIDAPLNVENVTNVQPPSSQPGVILAVDPTMAVQVQPDSEMQPRLSSTETSKHSPKSLIPDHAQVELASNCSMLAKTTRDSVSKSDDIVVQPTSSVQHHIQ